MKVIGQEDIDDDIVEEAVGLCGEKVEDVIECLGWELALNQDDEGLGDRFILKVALAEDGQDIFNARAGGFAKDIFPLEAFKIVLDGA